MPAIEMSSVRKFSSSFIACFFVLQFLAAQTKVDSTRMAAATEVYSPVPPIVTPGKTDAEPPSDAIILFDGKNLDLWRAEGPDSTKAAGWKVHDQICLLYTSDAADE